MRVKRGKTSHKRHKKLLKSVKGYRMTKSRLVKVAKEAQLHAGVYSFAGRRDRKSDFRRLWITRISGRLKKEGVSYSFFMSELKKNKIALNRKMLDYLIRNDDEAFKALIDKFGKKTN